MNRFYPTRPTLIGMHPTSEPHGETAERLVLAAGVLLGELLSFYPGRRILFIARDMEYFHDISQVLCPEPERSRFELINVSRTSAQSALLQAYLQQWPESDQYVLVDSGFNGNIIQIIREHLPQRQLAGHLICSEHPAFPSSHAAMHHLGVRWSGNRHNRKRQVEDAIEYLPHFTSKSHGYALFNGKYEAICPNEASTKHWEAEALVLMQQVRNALHLYHQDLLHSIERIQTLCDHLTLKVRVPTAIDLRGATGLDGSMLYPPLGLTDFLRELQDRDPEGHLQVVLDSNQLNNFSVWCEGRFRLKWSLEMEGSPVHLVQFPGGDVQKGASHALEQLDHTIEQHRGSAEDFQHALQHVFQTRWGRAVVRDVLEGAAHQHFDLLFDPSRIGSVWQQLMEPQDKFHLEVGHD